MKISKIFAIILGIVSLGLAAVGLLLMEWNEEAINYDYHNQFKLFAVLFAVTILIFVIIAIAKKNKAAFVPLLGFVATGIYFVKKLYDSMIFNQSIFDVLLPTDSNSVLTLLLFVGFVGCVIASIVKDNKFTKLYVVGYFALLILSSFKIITEITMNKDLMPITLVTYSMIIGYASFMLFYIPTNEVKTAEEKTETE